MTPAPTRGCLGRSDHARVHAVGQAVDDIAGDLVADMADERGDHEPGDRVPQGAREPPRSGRRAPRPRKGIQPGMPGISDERGGADALADDQFVPGDDLVAGDADDGPGDTSGDMGGVAMVDELAEALYPAKTALAQMTTAMPMPARSSARSSP